MFLLKLLNFFFLCVLEFLQMNLVQLLHRLNIFTLAMFCFQLLQLLFVLHLHVLELLIIPFEQQLQALLVVVPHFLGFLMLLVDLAYYRIPHPRPRPDCAESMLAFAEILAQNSAGPPSIQQQRTNLVQSLQSVDCWHSLRAGALLMQLSNGGSASKPNFAHSENKLAVLHQSPGESPVQPSMKWLANMNLSFKAQDRTRA